MKESHVSSVNVQSHDSSSFNAAHFISSMWPTVCELFHNSVALTVWRFDFIFLAQLAAAMYYICTNFGLELDSLSCSPFTTFYIVY